MKQQRMQRIDAEIQRVLDMGVQSQTNHRVTDVLGEMKAGQFDAAFHPWVNGTGDIAFAMAIGESCASR